MTDERAKQDLADAAQRIRQALEDGKKVKGFRGPKGEKQLVEVVAGHVVTVCESIRREDRDKVIDDLQLGSARARSAEKRVVIQADDAFYLLEVAGI